MDLIEKYSYGMLEPSEEEEVRACLVSNSEEPQVLKRINEIILAQQEYNTTISAPAFKEVAKRLNISRKSGKIRMKHVLKWAMVAAVVILLPIAGAYFNSLFSTGSSDVWEEVTVPFGEVRELVLADGTSLYLNSGSRVTYPLSFSGDERRIFVEGEIYADVAKNERKPFHINSGDVDVEVLGTRFNFKSYKSSKSVEVLLMDGTVQVDIQKGDRLKKNLLSSGEMLQYDRETGEISLQDFDPEEYMGFYNSGSIHFFNLCLGDIIEDLQRIFNSRIILLDEHLADKKYFAWFTNDESLEQILKSLCLDGQMKFYHKSGAYYITE